MRNLVDYQNGEYVHCQGIAGLSLFPLFPLLFPLFSFIPSAPATSLIIPLSSFFTALL